MSLIVYKAQQFKHTAENQQYRAICKTLSTLYRNKDETCLFIANCAIGHSNLDGIIFKKDAIIIVEFKNYGGPFTAKENEPWVLKKNGETIKGGGSGKNPYMQALINRSNVMKALDNYSLLPPSDPKRRPAVIIVFNQPIYCDNKLSIGTDHWLKITDNYHFKEVVSDVVDEMTNLSEKDFPYITYRLGLSDLDLDRDYSDHSDDFCCESDSDSTANEKSEHQNSQKKMRSKNKILYITNTIVSLTVGALFTLLFSSGRKND